jgi:hypothetical protein
MTGAASPAIDVGQDAWTVWVGLSPDFAECARTGLDVTWPDGGTDLGE